MATLARANGLPAVLAGALALAALGGGVLLLGRDEPPATLATVPAAPTPDADSPATVLRTLSAQLTELKKQAAAAGDENRDLKNQLQRLQAATEQARAARPPPATDPIAGSSLLDALQTRLAALERRPPASADLPVGRAPVDPEALTWVEPLDREFPAGGAGPATGGAMPASALPMPALPAFDPAPALAARTAPAGATAPPAKPAARPVYTLPTESTLLNATAWTALLGRVPVHGRVADPFRFKLLTGADNLAANGHRIPGLEGMVWSGTALGDLALSCVRGELTSVTFIFQDGTINTVRASGGQSLGWISDDRGVPCVPGALHTNAPRELAQRVALRAATAAALAAAAAQTTTGVSGTGAVSGVTGDPGRYVLGRTLASGADEVDRWVEDRAQQTFDVVLVRPGAPVALHIEQSIPIDYQPAGRRVSHEAPRLDPYRTSRLD